MRLVCLAVMFAWAGCDSCPDGNAGDSLFCHGASCAADESVCAGACANLQSDRDNCGVCGMQCGDGLVCSFGACVEGCDNGLVNCAGVCVDPATDTGNCGGCAATDPSHTCAATETCSDGMCGCTSTQLTCVLGGAPQCVDPLKDNNHCGATGDCSGAGAGTACVGQQACLNGNCESTLIYRGSLPKSTGRWTFQGVLGLTGANAACDAAFPGTEICTFTKLQQASMKATPETLNATDTTNAAVVEWWIDDPNDMTDSRCIKNSDAIPWSYQTADEGHKGLHVVLDNAGGIGMPISSITCSTLRNVPCCSKITAP